eukprot:5771851-Amphidinium_carterae.1
MTWSKDGRSAWFCRRPADRGRHAKHGFGSGGALSRQPLDALAKAMVEVVAILESPNPKNFPRPTLQFTMRVPMQSRMLFETKIVSSSFLAKTPAWDRPPNPQISKS